MQAPSKKEQEVNFIEHKVTIQMITFCVMIAVTILTLVFFIHIYSQKKEQVLKDLKTESIQLETLIADHLNYSRYFINIIGMHIQNDHNNLAHIYRILQEHFKTQDYNILFGWRKYSWVNKNYMEVVTSTEGIMSSPKKLDYLKNMIEKNYNIQDESYWKNRIGFYNKKYNEHSNSLKIVDNVYDKNTGQYIGSVVLSYDITTMVKSLNTRKKNKHTNFIILDKNLDIVAKSKPIIQNLANLEDCSPHLQSSLKVVKEKQESEESAIYLDMLDGLNYFVNPLQDLPFILVVSIDSDVIKHEIINDLAKSFVSVCIFAALSLFAIIFIYRRETFLRTKAEKASLVARNATKAKTNFLAFTAHEIRMPLGFILTGSEMMEREFMGKLPEKYKKYVQGIHHNAKMILNFIDDILDENQILEGKFKIVNGLHDICNIIEEAINSNLASFNTRKIDVQLDAQKNLPLVICDSGRMLQVMSNLISNSIKYSKDNTKVTITVRILGEDMVIAVMDQGRGMKEYEIPVALSAYGRITHDNDEYGSKGSYGLGLAIVSMLLEAHEAELKISSVENKGTTVKIIFSKNKLVYPFVGKNNSLSSILK